MKTRLRKSLNRRRDGDPEKDALSESRDDAEIRLRVSIESNAGSSDPLSDTSSAANLMGRALRGTPAIIARQALTAGVTILAGVVLARVLSPAEFGVYALTLIVVGIARVITDGGLGAALVSGGRSPLVHDYRQIYTVQSAVGLIVAVTVSAGAFALPRETYDVDGWQVALTLTAAGALFAPLTSNATAYLERRLDYARLGLVSATQPIAFGIFSILTVGLGWSVIGIGAAALGSFALSGAIARSSGSPLGFTFDLRGLKTRLRFGVPFAGSQLVALTKDGIVPLLLGIVFSAAAAGEVAWAQQVAILPTLFVTSFSRYLFPMFSRLAGRRRDLSRGLETALVIFNCSVAGPAVLLVLWPKPITSFVYGDQWSNALGILSLLVAANVFAPTTAILLSAFSACGRPGVSLVMSLTWFAGTWILVPVLSIGAGLGPMGFGWANLILQLPGVVLFVVARRTIGIAFLRPIVLPWIIAGIALGGTFAASQLLLPTGSVVQIITGMVTGLVLTAVASALIYRRDGNRLIRLARRRPS